VIRFSLPLLCLFAFASCATHCPKEHGPPVEECEFGGRLTFEPPAQEAPSYPVWFTKSASREPVLLLHALPGLTGDTLRLALEMESWGYRVYVPSLYGESLGNKAAFGAENNFAAARFLKQNPRWDPWDRDDPGDILGDLREMTRWVSRQEGGKQAIVVGNCLTGSLPLALLDEPIVDTVVMAQPATPMKGLEHIIFRIPQKPDRAVSLGIPEKDLARAIDAMDRNSRKRVIGFHYLHDPLAPIEKFDTLQDRLSEIGLEDRFRTYILAPSHRKDQEPDDRWTEIEVTRQRRTFIKPHTTIITGADCDDRNWFQGWLRAELAK